MNKNELAVQENFNLAISGDIADMMSEELDGLGEIPFDRIKIPSGGGLAFEVPGDDDDSPDVTKEIVGIVIDHHPAYGYWNGRYDGKKQPPQCASLNGKYGTDSETGEVRECKSCPLNAYGSAEDGSGKACKNMHRLYILQEDAPIPCILTLPPTSIKGWKSYLGKRVLMKGLRPHHVVTKISLKKEQSKGGIDYAAAQFSFAGKLPDRLKAELDDYREALKKTTRELEILSDDYGMPQTASRPEATPEQEPCTPCPADADNVFDDLPFEEAVTFD